MVTLKRFEEEAYLVSNDISRWDYYGCSLYPTREDALKHGPKEIAGGCLFADKEVIKRPVVFYTGRVSIRFSWNVVDRRFVGTWTVEAIQKHKMPTDL